MPKGYWVTTIAPSKIGTSSQLIPSCTGLAFAFRRKYIVVAPPSLRPKPGLSSVW